MLHSATSRSIIVTLRLVLGSACSLESSIHLSGLPVKGTSDSTLMANIVSFAPRIYSLETLAQLP